jgi:hypothetical protein
MSPGIDGMAIMYSGALFGESVVLKAFFVQYFCQKSLQNENIDPYFV